MLKSCRLNANLSDLSTYRVQLMGIATLMIIICHANGYHVLLPRFLASLFVWGNFGVDIFFFCQVGNGCKANKQLSALHVLLFCVVSFVMSVYIGVWKCAWLIVPIMSYIFILLLKLTKDSWIDKSLKFLGTISLESYLTNITLKSLFGALAPVYFTSSIFYGHYLEYCIVIVAGLLIAYYVHGIAQRIVS